ncbi:hypothetical protein [Otariodibacter oris]|uniref:Uncharacterized protein n=1 Tax=Otariodibacter oris TaxID=1032623 RepID=A0A420XHQ6_9PAST|nr:hypothetical protein [Otariodibacter oris]QGM81307.1 hypothetical protein A6A10_07725 [Otariodibacter oris]RKR72872.1 hypothetical protein DES31_1039 [Otariodibacter oris]
MLYDYQTPSKLEIITFAILPVTLMLFIEMLLNHIASPMNSIFISPYLLTFFVTTIIMFIVLLKGQICAGQYGRLIYILPFVMVFALGNFLYSIGFTPKHIPMIISMLASLFIPFLYWKVPEDQRLYRTMLYLGLAIAFIGVLQYLIIYWIELPSLFNGIRANNFAQLMLGVLLAGWYLIIAKSRLEGFLKLLVLVALIFLVFNYIWVAFVLYQQLQVMPEMQLSPYFVFFAVQFIILIMLAWLLLGKSIKNPIAWTTATFLAMLYPFTNII